MGLKEQDARVGRATRQIEVFVSETELRAEQAKQILLELIDLVDSDEAMPTELFVYDSNLWRSNVEAETEKALLLGNLWGQSGSKSPVILKNDGSIVAVDDYHVVYRQEKKPQSYHERCEKPKFKSVPQKTHYSGVRQTQLENAGYIYWAEIGMERLHLLLTSSEKTN